MKMILFAAVILGSILAMSSCDSDEGDSNDIDIITPEVAADNMLNICNKNDFVFFEYFITDTYGHKKKREELLNEVDKLNRFIKSIWNNGDNGVDIILTSDHGNCEDISTGNHTTNPVPFLLISKNQKLKDEFYSKVASLTDFKEAVKIATSAARTWNDYTVQAEKDLNAETKPSTML